MLTFIDFGFVPLNLFSLFYFDWLIFLIITLLRFQSAFLNSSRFLTLVGHYSLYTKIVSACWDALVFLCRSSSAPFWAAGYVKPLRVRPLAVCSSLQEQLHENISVVERQVWGSSICFGSLCSESATRRYLRGNSEVRGQPPDPQIINNLLAAE